MAQRARWRHLGQRSVPFLKRYGLVVAAAVLLVVSLALFTWAEYNYFVDQAASHHEPRPGFWSAEHMHDYWYNLASNWQSEFLAGILVVAIIRSMQGDHKRDHT